MVERSKSASRLKHIVKCIVCSALLLTVFCLSAMAASTDAALRTEIGTAATTGGTVFVTDDVTLNTLTINVDAAGKSITIDGTNPDGGVYTISMNSGGANGIFNITGGSVTLTNIRIIGEVDVTGAGASLTVGAGASIEAYGNYNAIKARNGSSVTIDEGSVKVDYGNGIGILAKDGVQMTVKAGSTITAANNNSTGIRLEVADGGDPASLTVQGGTFQATSNYSTAITAYGDSIEIDIQGGMFTGWSGLSVTGMYWNESGSIAYADDPPVVTISGGEFTGQSRCIDASLGSDVTIEGGLISISEGQGVYASGAGTDLSISGGTIQCGAAGSYSSAVTAASGASLTVSGNAQITSTGNSKAIINSEATVTISGGFVSAGGVSGRGIDAASPSITHITGGTVSATGQNGYGIYATGSGSVVNISGESTVVRATGADSNAIFVNQGGSLTIAGSEVTASGINSNGIKTWSSTVNITAGTVSGTEAAIDASGGSVTVTGGTVRGENHIIKSSSAVVDLSGADMTVGSKDALIEAAQYVGDGKTISVSTNITLAGTSYLPVSGNKSFTINGSDGSGGVYMLDGGSGRKEYWENDYRPVMSVSGGCSLTLSSIAINGAVDIAGGGTALIVNPGASVTSDKARTLNTNGATIVISGGEVTNTKTGNSMVIRGENGATITVSGGTVRNTGSNSSCISGQGSDISISGGTIIAAREDGTGTEQGLGVKCNGNLDNTLTVSGGMIVANGDNACAISSTSMGLTISGGTIEATAPDGCAIKISSGTVSATDGTIHGGYRGVVNSGGTADISGATLMIDSPAGHLEEDIANASDDSTIYLKDLSYLDDLTDHTLSLTIAGISIDAWYLDTGFNSVPKSITIDGSADGGGVYKIDGSGLPLNMWEMPQAALSITAGNITLQNISVIGGIEMYNNWSAPPPALSIGANATITGENYGVSVSGATVSITAGMVRATGQEGSGIDAAGSTVNLSGGTVQGYTGITATYTSTISATGGTLMGTRYGVKDETLDYSSTIEIDGATVIILIYEVTVSGDNDAPEAGEEITLTLTIKDPDGVTVNYTGDAVIAVSGWEASPYLYAPCFDGFYLYDETEYISVSFVNGVGTANLVLYSATAQDIGFSISAESDPAVNTLTITPAHADPAFLELTQDIESPEANGAQFAQQPILAIVDAYGNVCTNSSLQVTAVRYEYDEDEWTLTGTLIKAAVNGVVTFDDLGASSDDEVGYAQIEFTCDILDPVVSRSFWLDRSPISPKSPVPTQTMTAGRTRTFTAPDIAVSEEDDAALTITGIVTSPAGAAATAVLNGGTVTVTGVAAGNTSMTVKVSDGTAYKDVTVPITVTAVISAEITPTAASFDKYSGSSDYMDIPVTLTLNESTLSGIWNGSVQLSSGGAYTVSDSTHLFILRSYLAEQPVGTTVLTFKFSAGSDRMLSVSIVDSTQAAPGESTGGGSAEPVYSAGVEGGSTLPVNINTATGSATVNVRALSDALSSGDSSVVTVPPIPGVSSYTASLPASSLSGTGSGSLTFSTERGSVTIPGNMLSGTGMSGTADITIGAGDKSNLPDSVKASLGDRPIIQLTLSINGVQSNWSNESAPVTASIPYTPTAAELANPEGIVVYYIDGSGNLVAVPNGRYDPATGTVTFRTTHFSLYAVAYNSVLFSDVSPEVWYSKAVNFIAARGITKGTGGSTFSPDAGLTRADFLVMLMRAYGIAPDADSTENFADAGNTYYTGYLAAAKRLGITAGVGSNLYAPSREITRQELFTLLYNALNAVNQLPTVEAGKTLSEFTDADMIASWAKDAMTHLVKTGTVGGSNGKLAPTDTTTRGQMAQVLYNLLGKE